MFNFFLIQRCQIKKIIILHISCTWQKLKFQCRKLRTTIEGRSLSYPARMPSQCGSFPPQTTWLNKTDDSCLPSFLLFKYNAVITERCHNLYLHILSAPIERIKFNPASMLGEMDPSKRRRLLWWGNVYIIINDDVLFAVVDCRPTGFSRSLHASIYLAVPFPENWLSAFWQHVNKRCGLVLQVIRYF